MLSGSVIPGLSVALSSRSTEKRLFVELLRLLWVDFITKVLESSVTFDNLNDVVKVAGHSVIV